MATRQLGGSCQYQARNLSRLSAWFVTTLPAASTGWIWMRFLAKSTPTRVMLLMEPLLALWLRLTSNAAILHSAGVAGSGKSLRIQVGAARTRLGRSARTTLLVLDAQSGKNTDTAASKGYDAGKKVSGIKRHIAVDTQGFPHAVAVTTAEVTDRKGALQALKRCKPNLGRVQSVLCDSGHTGEPFALGVRETLGDEVIVQIAKRSELHKFAVITKRWVVERSFGVGVAPFPRTHLTS